MPILSNITQLQESPANAKGMRDSSACIKAPANKCKIRKNLYFSAQGQGHCFRCQLKPVYDFLLVINCNLGPISHRFRDTATFRFKSLPPRAAQPFKVIEGHRSWS